MYAGLLLQITCSEVTAIYNHKGKGNGAEFKKC